jgi:hypothetical protein
MIHINNEKQSEDLADRYSVEIFKKYLPKCFLAISYFMLQVRLNTEKPIISNFKEYYEDYLTFRDNYPELKLPLMK